MESTLLELVGNLTALTEDSPSQKPTPTLTWVNVAIASSFILVNGKKYMKLLILAQFLDINF